MITLTEGDSSARRNARGLWNTVLDRPLTTQITGGAAATLLAALISRAAGLIDLELRADEILLFLGAFVLLVTVALLLRFRRHTGRVWPFMPILLLLIASSAWCGVFIDASLAAHRPFFLAKQETRVGRIVSPFGAAVGDCFDAPRVRLEPDHRLPDTLKIISCNKPHDAEVYFTGTAWKANATFPGDSVIAADAGRLCSEAFQQYIGIPPSRSAIRYTEWTPSARSWSMPDRQFECVAYSPDGPMNYSAKGSKS